MSAHLHPNNGGGYENEERRLLETAGPGAAAGLCTIAERTPNGVTVAGKRARCDRRGNRAGALREAPLRAPAPGLARPARVGARDHGAPTCRCRTPAAQSAREQGDHAVARIGSAPP